MIEFSDEDIKTAFVRSWYSSSIIFPPGFVFVYLNGFSAWIALLLGFFCAVFIEYKIGCLKGSNNALRVFFYLIILISASTFVLELLKLGPFLMTGGELSIFYVMILFLIFILHLFSLRMKAE